MKTKLSGTRLQAVLSLTLLLVGYPLASQGTSTVAKLGGQSVSMQELEEHASAQLQQVEQQRYTVLATALESLVDQKLLDMEAAARGITAVDLVAAEVTDKIAEVTDADVNTWFETNRARLSPEQTLEEIGEELSAFLRQERAQTRLTDYLEELYVKYDVKTLLEPFRTEIDLTRASWKGNPSAPVTLVEFSDFQCPACRGFNPILTELQAKYPETLKVAFLQNPLRSIHPLAQDAAEASLCARDADKFWELHDEMFANQRQLSIDDLKAAARKIGLDGETFDACLEGDKYADVVQSDVEEAGKAGVTGTPSVFINGRNVSPGRVPSLSDMAAVVDDELERLNRAGSQP